MAIDHTNFAHIETTADGTQVLFYLEWLEGSLRVHQIVSTTEMSVDVSIDIPEGKASDDVAVVWPGMMNFAQAAENVIDYLRHLEDELLAEG